MMLAWVCSGLAVLDSSKESARPASKCAYHSYVTVLCFISLSDTDEHL